MYSPPVDLSFRNISNVAATAEVVPRIGLRPLKLNSKGKHLSRALRLNNNCITDITGLQDLFNNFLAQPSNLGWLDLSFNNIKVIDQALCELHELRVLYLHANCIQKLSEVDKLGELEHLHTITLHGNAIQQKEGYRIYVISALPHLKKMDFSAITYDERVLASRMKHHKNTKGESPLTVGSSLSD